MRATWNLFFILVIPMGPGFSGATEDFSECPKGLREIARGFDLKTAQLASEHSVHPRNLVGARFRELAERHNRDARALKWGPARPAGTIEPLPAGVIPKDPELAAMANRVNEMFQSEKEILDFVQEMARRAGETHARREGLQYEPAKLIKARDRDASFLQTIATEQKWGPIGFEETILDEEIHRLKILGSGRLHYDVEAASVEHASTAHILQWLMVTPTLEREFGAGAARRLLQYMSTSEGYGMWIQLFDRGPTYYRDFRGPRSFERMGIAGSHSWLGVK